MDIETGENYPDQETGETPSIPHLNMETGEREMNRQRPIPSNKRPFKIPKNCTKQVKEKIENDKKCHAVKKNVHSSAISFAFLLFIPVFFMPAVGVLISFIEVVLHMWAHKKNKKLKNSDFIYQSPFHVFLSEFCHLCIDENAKNKITKLQDKRNYKFTKYSIEYVRRVVR